VTGTERNRAAGVLAMVAIVLVLVPALLHLTKDASYPELPPRSPTHQALTRRVLIVVVDGLRHDYATNPTLAPSFSSRMARHSSGVVWAGRITMTSAAVLAFGTGARGMFSQIVLNVDARRTTANHVFENARAAGLRVGLIGDPIWKQAYGGFDFEHLSIADLALSVDDSPELFQVAHERVVGGSPPELTVLHFFANDHQAHVHGVFSPNFHRFFTRFDANLEKLLTSLSRDTTVLVLSDHGALENGNHGVDSELERKTPFFAFGPGIRAGAKLELEQVDLAPTIAALLGLPSPAQGVGAPAVELLDLDAEAGARLAENEADGVRTLAKAEGVTPSDSSGRPATHQERVSSARETIRGLDSDIRELDAQRGLQGFLWSVAILFAFGAATPWLLGNRSRSGFVVGASAFAGALLGTVILTAVVDRSLPPWNDTRGVVSWLVTIAVAVFLLAPSVAERVTRRFPALTLAIVPGCLFASFPTNTQLHTGIVATLCLVAVTIFGRGTAGWKLALAAGVFPVLVLLRIATVRDDPLGAVVARAGAWPGIAMLVVWLVFVAFQKRSTDERPTPAELVTGGVLVFGALLPHDRIPAAIGLSGIALLPLAALASGARGRFWLTRALLAAAFALVSRPVDLLAVSAAALLGEVIGSRLAAAERPNAARPFAWSVVLLTLAGFCLAYGVRVGLSRGLDFGNMDFAAGTFDSTQVSPTRVTLSLVVKNSTALALVVFALLSWQSSGIWRASLRLFSAGLVLRLATMAAILFAPPVSFWSRFRMVGEIGPVAVLALLLAIGVIVLGDGIKKSARIRQSSAASNEKAV
jgi:hypothetical protein